MKIRNKLIYALLMISTVVGFSCKDNFSEKEFLEQQADLAEQNKQALQADLTTLAGFILQLVDVRSGESISDLSVSLISGAGNAPYTATSDVDGNAKFVDLPTGGYTLLVTGDNYIDLSATIFFNDNSILYVDGLEVVKRRNESARILMTPTTINNGTTELATISGNVTAELDLTNLTSEIPQNISISVALPATGNAGSNRGPSSGYLSAPSIAGSQGYGTSQVDNVTGKYTVQVPAIGESVSLLFPDFIADQIIAYDHQDNIELAEPVLGAIPTGFGGNYSYDVIPFIRGAKAVFPTPPAVSGSGLAFSTTPTSDTPIGMGGDPINEPGDVVEIIHYNGLDYTFSLVQFKAKSLGAGYTESPDIAVSGGGATTDAIAYAGLRGIITQLTSDGGAGYLDGENVTIEIYAIGVNPNDPLDQSNILVASMPYTISGTKIESEIDLSGLDGEGFSTYFNTASNSYIYGYNVTGFTAKVIGATPPLAEAGFTVDVNCQLGGIRIVDGGTGYTSSPDLVLSGGNATSQAIVEPARFLTFAFIEIDNTNVTPYDVLPEISIQLNNGYTVTNDANMIIFGVFDNGAENFSNADINDLVTLDENGFVQWKNPDFVYMTPIWALPDGVSIGVSPLVSARMADATVSISPGGEVDGLTLVESGYGYRDVFDATILPTFPSISGSGVEVQIGVSSTDGVGSFYTWNGSYDIISAGSGYVTNVNQQPFIGNPGNMATVNSIVPGGEYIVNWNYGTGETLVDVD